MWRNPALLTMANRIALPAGGVPLRPFGFAALVSGCAADALAGRAYTRSGSGCTHGAR